ncbi:hypothetical protein DD565_06465 [Vibrio cholerae]|nr:hypothetical protein DD565_06465 [Vibrio cholerae]
MSFHVYSCTYLISYNARLRGWQRITPNSNTTTETTAAQWDWKRHALTVPLEAFVMCVLLMSLVQLQ